MKTRPRPSVQAIRMILLTVGAAAALAVAAAAALPPVPSGAATMRDPSFAGSGQDDPAGQTDPAERDDTYVNSVQGYSVRFDGEAFGVEEHDDGAGQTTFYLIDSVLATSGRHGSGFTVSYLADWDGYPDAAQYFEEKLFNARMADPDSFVQMTSDPYDILQAGDVWFPTASWVRTDAETGRFVLEIRAVGVVEGGGCAYFGATMAEEEVQVVADALGKAVGSFRVDPDVSGGTPVTWADADAPAAQGGPGDASPVSVEDTFDYTPATKTDGFSYYIQVPQEWTGFTEYGGYGESTLVEAYDYFNPSVRMTFWGLQEIPGTDLAAQMAGLPLVMPGDTVADFVELLPDLSYRAALDGQLGMPDEVRILSVEILGVDRVRAVTDALAQVGMDGMVTDEAIVKARVILDDGNNTEVTALIYGTVAATGLGDFLSYSVMAVHGIFAPPDMFGQVARALVESGCGRYSLHETYVREHPGTEYDEVIYASAYRQWSDYILTGASSL